MPSQKVDARRVSRRGGNELQPADRELAANAVEALAEGNAATAPNRPCPTTLFQIKSRTTDNLWHCSDASALINERRQQPWDVQNLGFWGLGTNFIEGVRRVGKGKPEWLAARVAEARTVLAAVGVQAPE